MSPVKYNIMQPLAYLNEATTRLALQNTYAIQLTEGCSGACAFCCFDSRPPVRGYASFASLKELADRLTQCEIKLGEIMFYHASDPLDYFDPQEEAGYLEVVKLFHERGLIKQVNTTTCVPRARLTQIKLFTLWYMLEQLRGGFTGGLRFSVKPDNEDLVKEVLLEVFGEFLKTHTKYELNLVAKRVIEDLLPDYLVESASLPWSIDIHRIDTTTATKTGRAYAQGNREVFKDCVTCACYDGVVLTPTAVKAVCAVAVTDDYKNGVLEWDITPSNQQVPMIRWVDKGRVARFAGEAQQPDSPEQLHLEILHTPLAPIRALTSLGKVVTRKSLNRDLLAMYLLADPFNRVPDGIALRGSPYMAHILKDLTGKYRKLKRRARFATLTTKDKEAKRAYKTLTKRLDGLLGLTWFGRL